MIAGLAKKIFGTKNEREIKSYQPLIDKINALEPELEKFSDSDLQQQTVTFRARLEKGETLDDLLPEAFATVREAAKRVLGMRHYDVQLIGGICLHRGKIAEMRTGEGKTLVGTLPVYLNALPGKGVHVITVNDYLAERDSEWMGKVYQFLGMTVGCILNNLNDRERKEHYGCDITYGTNNEFGFDYLRDNMKFRLDEYVQRDLNYCIIDEVDSILIDEARTPLIISGPTDDSTDKYVEINKIIPNLKKDVHFSIDEKAKSAALNEDGIGKVEELLNIPNLYDPRNIDTLHHVQAALKAHVMFKKDVDYVVRDGQVVIVDEFTGRIMPGRRWSDGLHQAVEAKEGVNIEKENQTLASVTFQNYFRLYNKLAGMTGTADTEAVEFRDIYKLDVLVIPTNKPIARDDQDDAIYKDNNAKYRAIVNEIKEAHERKQPVLVGTISIERNEMLGRELKKSGVPHNILNAKQHEREAEIISQAGWPGAVTIATNMAGRGTDIVLGGNAEALAKLEAEEDSEEYAEILKKYEAQCKANREVVLGAGGLFIIGTERHESRRIDNQLRGRAGRQGDPGRTKFFLSLEDDLFRIFGGERMRNLMGNQLEDDEPITHPWLSRAIENAQKKVEAHNYDIRKHLLKYDDVMNMQRKVIYGMRKEILASEDLSDTIHDYIENVAEGLGQEFGDNRTPISEWNLEALNTNIHATIDPLRKVEIHADDIKHASVEGLRETIETKLKARYEERKKELAPYLHDLQRMIILSTIDQLWKEHLQQLDHLREGIGLRGYAQKDPLLEYKKESFFLFQTMDSQIRQDVLGKMLSVQLHAESAEDDLAYLEESQMADEEELTFSRGQQDPESRPEPMRKTKKVGRNEPCPCGSGKKYKHCHGRNE